MKIYSLLDEVEGDYIRSLDDFLDFAQKYLDFVCFGERNKPNIQMEITSRNDKRYHFFQYLDDGYNCVTRPVNTELMIAQKDFQKARGMFLSDLDHIRDMAQETEHCLNLNRIVYTCQQSIGCTLDALNNSNRAKKKNGNYFEFLIRDIVQRCGVNVDDRDEVILHPSGEKVKFEHDIILLDEESDDRAIGQLKTSSKDRIDKIFLDKHMYNKLKGVKIPHFAIFLNDVQRKGKSDYGINSTFLPGHFKEYTMALNPLDGVYYVDVPTGIKKDPFLNERIHTFDRFLTEGMWEFL